MMYLSKEAADKDHSLKMKLLVSNNKANFLNTEQIWPKNGFLGDQKGELNINKANFPENILIYVSQGSISTLKKTEQAFYMDYVILSQPINAKNLPDDFENYESKLNEVKCTHVQC